MRILCCCEGGNTRSVTLATMLKYDFGGHDALACSLQKNSDETLIMLFKWANTVIVVDAKTLDKARRIRALAQRDTVNIDLVIQESFLPIMQTDIGPDRWGSSMHEDLIPICWSALEKLGFTSKRKTLEQTVARRGRYRLKADGLLADVDSPQEPR